MTLKKLTRKKIFAFVKTVWPLDKPTPWFRNHTENTKKLMEVTDQLGDQESYTFPIAGLGKKAIEEIMCKWMQERRRKENYPLSLSSYQDSGGNSSSSSSSILSAQGTNKL